MLQGLSVLAAIESWSRRRILGEGIGTARMASPSWWRERRGWCWRKLRMDKRTCWHRAKGIIAKAGALDSLCRCWWLWPDLLDLEVFVMFPAVQWN